MGKFTAVCLLLLAAAVCFECAAGTEKRLEGREFEPVLPSHPLGRAGHSRTRRQAEAQFIPFRYYGSDNDPAKAGYPRSPEAASSPVDTLLKYRYGGVPVSPQKARLRGELSHMNPNEGRVEVEYRGTWGLACGDYFGREEANVYCRNLGFKKGANKPYGRSFFGTGNFKRWDILIGHVKCAAYRGQSNLFQCSHNLMPACSLNNTAGVECTYNEGCEFGWSAYDGLCYRVESGPMTAEDAAKACKAKGAKLVAVNSQGENSFITNMLYTKFQDIAAAWTGGQYARFRDQLEYDAWTFKDTIHLVKSDSKLWFPGFTESDARPIGNKEKQSCIAISKIFYKSSERRDVDTNYFWWDNISCKTELPYICQKLGTLTSDCYSQSGGNYRGEAARTDKGTPCQPWSENRLVNSMTHPGQGLGEHNLCRNPDGDTKPWCWVDNERNVFGYCSLRLCGEGEGGDGLPTDLKPSYNHSRCDSPDQYFCPSMINYRPTCVDRRQVCDSHKDCVGGEDEERELCKARCNSEQFYCRKSHRCIAISKVCDKQYDCDMGDDETPEACRLHKPEEESDAEVQKDYTKTEKVDESSIPSGTQSVSYYSLSLTQCKTRCDTMDRFVCAAFIYNHNATFGIRCTLLAQKIADVRPNDAVGESVYYEKKQSCNPDQKFQCKNTRCVDKAALCNGYDDCGDFSDEVGPSSCPDPKPTFSVRLSGGRGNYEGRVEVKLFNEWGLMCDDGLNENLGKVVCNQLGFPMGYEKLSKNAKKEYGRGDGKFLMGAVACRGTEASLYDCPHSGWKNIVNCTINNVAGIVCLWDRACTDKEFRCSGRCIPLSQVCDGTQQCTDGADEESCGTPTLALRNGDGPSSGFLEITRNGIAGAVCDDMFGDNEAKVVCAQLGIPGRFRLEPEGTFKTPGGTVMWLQDVKCSGSESSLFSCAIRNWGRSLCEIREAVNLRCGLPEPTRTTTQPPTTTTPARVTSSAKTCGQRIGRFPAGRIINGYPAIRGQFPWQVGIRLKVSETDTRQHCGGTIINDRWIVTAAHCFDYPKSYYAIRVGDLDNMVTEEFERQFDIDLVFIHPQYSGQPSYDYDITLIRIQPDSKGYIEFNAAVQPACLPEKTLQTTRKTVCHISGWGSVGDMQLPRNLMAANVPLIANARCNQLYPGRITDRMQCAGFEAGGIDSCQGDSGGPLVCPIDGVYTLLGATSWGEGCAMPGSPGVYANIRNLRDWIDETMRNNP
ncbi:hypothetical protein BOX15_Mlig019787g1 [Macrostomum lignano]|uniref:Serine protease 12 n=1 Tax=Macrostomum lignano TaxID=282301 RepID=A0A267FDY5_9PLAT|nr:hypothetical protein BOX15_Mlig019787g1 [Macrostomum lignano]